MKKIILCGDAAIKGSGIGNTIKKIKETLVQHIPIEDRSVKVVLPNGILSILPQLRQHIRSIFFKNKSKNSILFSGHTSSLSSRLISFRRESKAALVHDLFYPSMYKDKTFQSPIEKLLVYISSHTLWKTSLRRYDIYFTISDKVKQDLIKIGIPKEKITTIWNGIHHDFYSNEDAKEVPNPMSNDYIFSIASSLERKNMKGILETFCILKKEFPQLKLVKAGEMVTKDKRGEMLKFIPEKIREEIASDIVFLGNNLSVQKIKAYYKHSKMLLFPSKKEGFGLPILEAQAVGVPVITSNYPPMSDLIPYKELLVDPCNSVEIAEKCSRILKDDSYRQACIEKGKKFSSHPKFQWETIAYSIFKEVEKFSISQKT